MNIFYVSKDLTQCAQALDDIRLRKMVLETAQILETAAFLNGCNTSYQPTHTGHPCVVWATVSAANFATLLDLFKKLCSEYEFRFQKGHASASLLEELEEFAPRIQHGEKTPPPNCTDFKDEPCTTTAYRRHLVAKWRRDATAGRSPKWTRREPPLWLTFGTDEEEKLNADTCT